MRALRLTMAAATLAVAACSGKKDDAKAALSRDTALAADLREAGDTAALNEAADVSMRDIPDSTLPMPPSRTMTTHPGTTPATPAPRSPAPRTPSPASPAESPASPAVPMRRPTTPHPTPIPVTPPDVRPSPAPALPRPTDASASSASAGDYPTPACASPAMADQRACLIAYLARSDVTLDRNYQAEIRRRRAEAGTPPGAPDPESVQRLRSAQRAWLVYRDTECRNRNRGLEGPLWAPVRARCLGEFSQARAAELAK